MHHFVSLLQISNSSPTDDTDPGVVFSACVERSENKSPDGPYVAMHRRHYTCTALFFPSDEETPLTPGPEIDASWYPFSYGGKPPIQHISPPLYVNTLSSLRLIISL
jgi:hypothetical protein